MKRLTRTQKSQAIEEIHYYGIDIENRDIFVRPSDNTEDIDFNVASLFIRNLRILNNFGKDDILIHMMTCGGSWEYGMAMYDALKMSEAPTTVLSYAHARSMSSLIPQAATYRVLTQNCLFMIHEGFISTQGTNKQVTTEIEWNNKSTQEMLNIYAEKCCGGQYFKNWNIDKIKKFLKDKMDKKEDWYMTAREAVRYGFADAVLGDEGYQDLYQIRAKY